ncbi:MORN repeat-containing protein 2 [Octopus bimaculoides]|uniref:MORN repeat-containing protein 2 n=1 Tax=Octopus bimaculoides TaxID=37653 RepID=UPI00071DDFC5|nr:MORN repeat-containing protein 2 [Octopus bimaculoides]|eukprot:XP_014789518.1 PREDICTED: MORN repeat-containing protein 2-like [Octopus bimaculoides]
MAVKNKKLYLKQKEKNNEANSKQIQENAYIFPNGDRYEGQFLYTQDGNVQRSGFGRYIAAEGTVYQGMWKDDAMNGIGQLKHSSGDVYEGDFLNNQFHGEGTYTWANGSFVKGNFVRNKLDGKGQFCDTMKQLWDGDFHKQTATGLRFKLNMN